MGAPKYFDLGYRFGKRVVIGQREQRYGKFYGYICRCDCGTENWIQVSNIVSGIQNRCKACSNKDFVRRTIDRNKKRGAQNHNWKGGRNRDGYVRSSLYGNKKFEHRVVMEGYLGRELLTHEFVHHLNGQRDDNRLENLELWSRAHPPGQRVVDRISWAVSVLTQYAPHLLK